MGDKKKKNKVNFESVVNSIKTRKALWQLVAGLCMVVLFWYILMHLSTIWAVVSKVTKILRPFVFGFIIAYVMRPIAKWLENLFCTISKKLSKKDLEHRKVGRIISISLTLLLALAVILALVWLIVPQVIDSVMTLTQTLPPQIEAAVLRLETQIAEHPEIVEQIDSIYEHIAATITGFMASNVMPNLQKYLTAIGGGAVSALVVFKDIIIGVIVAIYLLGSREYFKNLFNRALSIIFKPKAYQAIVDEVVFADQSFNGFINGKLLDSAIVGVICYIFCVIAKMPNALLVAVIIGITNIIPFFGPFIGAIPMALLIAVTSPVKAFIFAVFILILQQVDGNIIGPKILGNTTGLSSFWVLFAITLFGGLFGVPGMIVGVPITCVIRDIIKKVVHHHLEKKKMEEQEVVPISVNEEIKVVEEIHLDAVIQEEKDEK